MYIEILGGMGVGKTSLAKLIADNMKDVQYQGEDFFQENPFLKDFFKDPAKMAFETQTTFLLQIYHARKMLSPLGNYVFDYSTWGNYCFAVSSGMNKKELNAYLSIWNDLNSMNCGMYSEPDLYIYLDCTIEEQINRIKKRGRDFETIQEELLQLHQETLIGIKEELIDSVKPVIVLDANCLNWVDSESDKKEVLRKVCST